MVDVQEHIYNDDPGQGHPDVRTRLKGVSYFFLGNGRIQAAVQLAPAGEGTPVGLLVMDPEVLGKKRESLTMDPTSGLEATMVSIRTGQSVARPKAGKIRGFWQTPYAFPGAVVEWEDEGFLVRETFFCPSLVEPWIDRIVEVRSDRAGSFAVQTGEGDRHFSLAPGPIRGQYPGVILRYILEPQARRVSVRQIDGSGPDVSVLDFWKGMNRVRFDAEPLDRFFHASLFQLTAVISSQGKVDGSIWQYNREWVRDQSIMAISLAACGNQALARTVLGRLLRFFVTDLGDTRDSSETRGADDVELDQNGELLHALREYVLWTGDVSLIEENWKKVVALAEFLFRPEFRCPRSGLLGNRREYWERHAQHGIQKGVELAQNLYTVIGLCSAADLAENMSRTDKAGPWRSEAERIRKAAFQDPDSGFVGREGLFKRRLWTGEIERDISSESTAGLPSGVPLLKYRTHLLNPDTSSVLPIVLGVVPPDSKITARTMDRMERLWNQKWKTGGYGRYHISSEPDSPGPWPFPSVFVARAYSEAAKPEKVQRILNWLDRISGADAGSWFEFYGHRFSPPFPQVGVTPWTWAELLLLFIRHLAGIRPEFGGIRIRPLMLRGVSKIHGSFVIRNRKVELDVLRKKGIDRVSVQTDHGIEPAGRREVFVKDGGKDMVLRLEMP